QLGDHYMACKPRAVQTDHHVGGGSKDGQPTPWRESRRLGQRVEQGRKQQQIVRRQNKPNTSAPRTASTTPHLPLKHLRSLLASIMRMDLPSLLLDHDGHLARGSPAI